MNLIRLQEKLALAGVVCGIVAAMPRSTFGNPGKHGILYCMLYPRYGRSNGNASGGSGTVCKT